MSVGKFVDGAFYWVRYKGEWLFGKYTPAWTIGFRVPTADERPAPQDAFLGE